MNAPDPALVAISRWLDAAPNLERTGAFRDIRLERIAAFLRWLPTPPAPMTIAGTKGKGSTARLVECALLAAGERTLAFTSPHVDSVLERWRIDGVPAAAQTIAAQVERVADIEARHGVALTYFERTFAIAVLLAAAGGRRFICEVGLGGRLDCANALDAAVAVITHLSHDHRDVLGPTLPHIAREKLAIARPGRPLVIAPQGTAAALAIQRALPGDVQALWAQRPDRPFALALPGDHQQDNAATAWAALRRFAPGIDGATVRRGFASAGLAARCQLVGWGPRRVLVDGAHNGPSIAATLAVAAQRLRPGWRLIIGLAADKEIDEIAAVVPSQLEVVRCGYRSPRARGEDHWPARCRAWPWFATIGDALAATPGDTDQCITGSFYLAGEALIALGAQGRLPG